MSEPHDRYGEKDFVQPLTFESKARGTLYAETNASRSAILLHARRLLLALGVKLAGEDSTH